MSRPNQSGTPPNQSEVFFFQPIVEKNRWLIRIRWIYPFFIFIFLLLYRSRIPHPPQYLYRIGWLLSLALIINAVFFFDFRRKVSRLNIHTDYKKLAFYTSIQLDCDLLIIFLHLYFLKAMESPLINLFYLYVILAPFLVEKGKALRGLFTAIFLLSCGMLLADPDRFFDSNSLVGLGVLTLLFGYTFFVSSFLAQNLRKNEDVLQQLLLHTHELSISDGLTGLFNQSHFFELLENETKKSLRHSHNYSLIMFDVDFFKNYNDHNGHLRGSAALRRVGGIMKKIFRTTDILAKYGGDEFVIILPQTEKVGAYLAAERFREAIEREPFPGAQQQPMGKLTVSLGISSFPEHGTSTEEIVERTDKALYLAKELGRNRTVIYHEGIEEEESES